MTFSACFSTVSYTHLDVYKRQFLYCRSQGIGFEEAGKFAAAMCTLKLEHSGPFDRSIEEVRAIIRKHEK